MLEVSEPAGDTAGSSLPPEDVTVHVSISFPYSAAPKGVIMRKVRRVDQPDRAFVEKLPEA